MEEDGEDEHQQREMEEAYRKMMLELESEDEEEVKGSVPVKTEKDEVDSKLQKKVKGADDKLPLLNESLSSSLGIALADRHGTPPPPSIIVIEENSDVKINVEPKQYEQKVPTDEQKNSIPGGGGGRTSPNGRTSPLRNNRVEPINEKQTPHEIHANKNNNIHSLLTDK